MITRRPDEKPETYEAMRERFDRQCRLCRDEQNRHNAESAQAYARKEHEAAARTVLNRLRRRPNEIDPEGRL